MQTLTAVFTYCGYAPMGKADQYVHKQVNIEFLNMNQHILLFYDLLLVLSVNPMSSEIGCSSVPMYINRAYSSHVTNYHSNIMSESAKPTLL